MPIIDSKLHESAFSKYPNLKKQLRAGENSDKKDVWTRDNLIDGFRKFFDEHQRYPMAHEIDHYQYLPSSRQIQRKYGGLIKLRQSLGLEIDNYSAGSTRSKLSTNIGVRGSKAERELEQILTDYFGEYFVHVEKPLYQFFLPHVDISKRYKQRADFFVYSQPYRFCVDVFYARDLSTLKRIINIKEQKYSGLSIDIYLVNFNDLSDISDEGLIKFSNNKIRKLESNMKLMNKSQFINFIHTLKPLKAE